MTYSNALAISRQQRFGQRNQNTTSFRGSKQGIGPVSNTIILIVLACLLGLLYLAQVTKTNSFGYQINALNEQQTNLRQEHADLEIASARLQALERVSNSKPAKQLVSVTPSGTVTR